MRHLSFAYCVTLASLFVFNGFAIASENVSPTLCSPKTNLLIRVPLATSQTTPQALAVYPLIEEVDRGYIIVFKDHSGSQTIALLPFRDRLGNPTADTGASGVTIRGQANAELQPGFIRLASNKVYRIVERSNDAVKVRFTCQNFTQDVWVASETIHAADIQDSPTTKAPTNAASGSGTNINPQIDLVTSRGVVYRNFKITRSEPDGLSILHSGGIAKIPLWDLPEETRKRFNYDPVKAKEYSQRVQQAQATLHAQQQAAVQTEMEQRGAAFEAVRAKEQLREIHSEVKQQRVKFRIKISQALDDGCLAYAYVSFGEAWKGGSVRYGSYQQYGNEPIFVVGMPSGLVDGDVWEGKIAPIGTYQYTTVLGAPKSVRKFVTADALNPDE